MGKYKHSKVMDFLNIFGETEIYTNLKNIRREFPYHGKIVGILKAHPNYGLLNIFLLKQDYMHSSNHGNYNFPFYGKGEGKLKLFSNVGFFTIF